MEIQNRAYTYTIDIITEIRYFCKCNKAVFGKFRIIFTCGAVTHKIKIARCNSGRTDCRKTSIVVKMGLRGVAPNRD